MNLTKVLVKINEAMLNKPEVDIGNIEEDEISLYESNEYYNYLYDTYDNAFLAIEIYPTENWIYHIYTYLEDYDGHAIPSDTVMRDGESIEKLLSDLNRPCYMPDDKEGWTIHTILYDILKAANEEK